MIQKVTADELKDELKNQNIQEVFNRIEKYAYWIASGLLLVLTAYILSGGFSDPSAPRDPAIKYVVDGLIGGLLYIFVQKIGWDTNGLGEIMRRIGIGMIAGYVVYLAGLPDSLTALGMGYAGIDMIEAVLNRVSIRRKE